MPSIELIDLATRVLDAETSEADAADAARRMATLILGGDEVGEVAHRVLQYTNGSTNGAPAR